MKQNKFKGLFSSTHLDWQTPKEVYEELDKEFNFNFDPCPPNPKFNGLEIEWKERNFVNPPYGREIGKWIKKGYGEWKKGRTIVFLIPSRTDTKWWHDYIMEATEIRFIKGRLKFEGYDGGSAPFPSAIVVFKGNRECRVCGICGGDGIDRRTYPSTECLCLTGDLFENGAKC